MFRFHTNQSWGEAAGVGRDKSAGRKPILGLTYAKFIGNDGLPLIQLANMKLVVFILLLFSSTLSSHSYAADPAPALHWYTVGINAGASTMEFTGSFPCNSDVFGSQVANLSSIELDNRREEMGIPDENPKVVIVTKNILYFVELPGDPAVQKK